MQQLLTPSPSRGLLGAAVSTMLAAGLFGPAADAQTVSGAPFFALVSPDPLLVLDEAVVAVGDVNGDGFDDLGLSATLAGTPIAAVLPGGPDGVGAVPLWVLVGVEPNHVLAGVGDLDGDGFDELALGEPEWDGPGDPNTGRVRSSISLLACSNIAKALLYIETGSLPARSNSLIAVAYSAVVTAK